MKRIAPSQLKEQAVNDLLAGKTDLDGKEMLSEIIRLSTEKTLQHLLEHEQTEFLGRNRYERGGQGVHRNGYEEGKLRSAEGVMSVQLPQVRGLDAPYRSKVWASLSRKSEVLEQIVTEMWVRGLSVRDVEEAMSAATGSFVLSDTAVSEVTEHLFSQYEAFRSQDLDCFDIAYLFIDAVYEPLRRYGARSAVLCAWGISTQGNRVLLNLATGSSESFETCIDFLRDMVRRGFRTPLTVTTDGAPGVIKAVETIWPKSKRVRCWFHKMQNLQSKVPPPAWAEFRALVEDIRDAPDRDEGERRLEGVVQRYSSALPEACRCLLDDHEASLNHLLVPRAHRRHVRTTNLVERSFVEERRRTKVIPQIWEEKSLTKLVFATLIRVSERWNRARFSDLETKQVLELRKTLGLDDHTEGVESKPKQKRRSASRVAA